ncbi:ABC transporter permease [Thermotoga neapolitana]|jgi:ribose transport system permease protein|uniref:Monosaccharide-transporting ATPase n=1 Tax=Thermotoga neapolitana (strain ATCC 49049 / DSM 4359 / NBRC 107923 / NS-E) TaxID=309803 RepID=B9KBZ7_THENN|nr:ABC transporter permease [Thermotoga neapolitana]ACM22543.1 Monosaccharide-transporting ATPase [Thermotoga neapolitana DSM 4359]KFZ22189.1 Monosaccharide-transporting ATPase [Thermotoga neapolitana LA10]
MKENVLKMTTGTSRLKVMSNILIRGGSLVGLLGLVIVFSVLSPYFFTISNWLNILRQVSVLLILASAQTMVIISAGIDLSVGAILALGGCLAAVAMSYWGWNFLLGSLLGVAVATLVGFFNGSIITKGRIPDFIATLGMLGAVRGVALLITGGLPVPSHFTATALKGYLPEALIWLGSGDIGPVPVPALVALIMVLITWFVLSRTCLGRSIYAVGGNREAARESGINVDKVKTIVYTLSGLYAGIAGLVMVGRMNSANALMAEGIELNTIAAVVIGGTNLFGGEGSVLGTLIGALLIGVLSNGLNLLDVEPFWQKVINGLLIIIIVVFDQWRRRRLTA